MTKIKEIHDRLTKNPVEYSEIRLLIAKRTLAFFIMFFFTSYLFTIGGFTFFGVDLPTLAQITFHAQTALTIMIGWFIYELSVYGVHIYADDHRWIIIVCLGISALFVIANLWIHILIK